MNAAPSRETLASVASMEGEGALQRGDTALARAKHAEAARILESAGEPRRSAEQHMWRFLVATQYFRAGMSGDAQKWVRHIEAGELPEPTRALLGPFKRDADERAAPDYAERTRAAIVASYTRNDYGETIELLRAHPFVLSADAMATLRMDCCDRLGLYPAAIAFRAAALRARPDDVAIHQSLLGTPFRLLQAGRYEESMAYLTRQNEHLDHPVGWIATVIAFGHFFRLGDSERNSDVAARQLGAFERFRRSEFDSMPAAVRGHRSIRLGVAYTFQSALITGRLEGIPPATLLEWVDEAIVRTPESGWFYTYRGILTYPERSALADFHRAAELGDPPGFAELYLAHDDLAHGRFGAALKWVALGLVGSGRQPSVRAFLLAIQSKCLAELGESRERVAALLREAQELAPAEDSLAEVVRLFEISAEGVWHVPDWPSPSRLLGSFAELPSEGAREWMESVLRAPQPV